MRSPWLTKPYRIAYSENGEETFRVYFRRFATEEEAAKQMARMSDSMMWDNCNLCVIQERNITALGRQLRKAVK